MASVTEQSSTLKTKLLGMMVFRVVIAFAFLGITLWFQLSEASLVAPFLYPLHVVVVAIGLLTIVYALLIKFDFHMQKIAYLQVGVDVLIITFTVYITGSLDSFFPILYVFSVIGATIVIGRTGGLWAASASSILYGLLIDLDYYRVLPQKYKILWSPIDPAWDDVITTILLNIIAFFSVAFLAGYLAEKTAKVERKLEEREIDLGRLEELNRKIVENIPNGVITLDSDGLITSFNRAAEIITGLKLKDVYSLEIEKVFLGLTLDSLDAVASEGKSVDKAFSLDSGEKWLGVNVSFGSGNDMKYVIVVQDLTAYKELEERLRRDDKLKALGELSASLAHEIRNPLASLSGSIQVLGEDVAIDGDKRHLMDIVLRETKRLNSLITDFLLFARPAEYDKEQVNICSIIADTLEVFSNSPEGAGLTVEFEGGSSINIKAERRQLSQVFWNLFINGAASMNGDNKKLTVKVSTFSAGSGEPVSYVTVSVKDCGVGIPADKLDSIFNPFYSTKEQGTGLGLSIVNRIVESHGGSISVKSKVGEGTEFIVTFPVLGEDMDREEAV